MSLSKRDVFEIVDLPEGRKALKLAEGRMKFNARLVALGCCGVREDVDYIETFAPVAKGALFAWCWPWLHSLTCMSTK